MLIDSLITSAVISLLIIGVVIYLWKYFTDYETVDEYYCRTVDEYWKEKLLIYMTTQSFGNDDSTEVMSAINKVRHLDIDKHNGLKVRPVRILRSYLNAEKPDNKYLVEFKELLLDEVSK